MNGRHDFRYRTSDYAQFVVCPHQLLKDVVLLRVRINKAPVPDLVFLPQIKTTIVVLHMPMSRKHVSIVVAYVTCDVLPFYIV